jgi:hypothetical protein
LKSKSFLLLFFKKEETLFFFSKKNQKTFVFGMLGRLCMLQVVVVLTYSLDIREGLVHFGNMYRLIILFLIAAFPASAMLPGMVGDREFFLPQVAQEATANGIPPEVADAVAMVETGYRPDAIGGSGEIGIMQILPSTAVQLGFRGTPTELLEPSINIHLAVQYLARAWAVSGGDICRALMKYRAGLGEEVMSPLSAQYCSRAIAWLMGTGSSRLAMDAKLSDGAAQTDVATDPYVIAIGPAPMGIMQAMPAPAAPQAAPASRARHRRTMAERAAALQASFDSHVRYTGDHATTSFEPGD